MSPFPQVTQPVPVGGVGGGVGDGPPPPPLEMHSPELGLPSHVQLELLLQVFLTLMVAQLNGVGEDVGLAVVGAAVDGGFVGTGADVGGGVGGFVGVTGPVVHEYPSSATLY